MPNDSLVPTPEPEAEAPPTGPESQGEPAPVEAGAEAPEADRPAWLPTKFATPEALATSYGELERAFHGKREEIEQEVREALASEIPEGVPETVDGYVTPETLDVTDPEAFAESDIAKWWRDTCHTSKLPQDAYAKGLEAYATAMMGVQPDLEAERSALGENADARLSAVGAWMGANAKDADEFSALQRMTQTASGVAFLERMASNTNTGPRNAPEPEPTLTLEEVRAMQADPKYYSQARRDPEYVKKVNEAYARLYPAS